MIQGSPARRDVILSRLVAGQPVSATALAAEFCISEDAIRRDLRTLASRGLCRRVYGGALPLDLVSLPMAERMSERLQEKRVLARHAVGLVDAGSFLFFDSGSTNVMAAEALPGQSGITAATNSIALAAALTSRADLPFVMVGGSVDAVIGGCVDAIAIEAVSRFNFDACFLGVCSLSARGGVSAFNADDAAFKRTVMARSLRVLVLAVNEKLGSDAPHRVAALDQIDRIVVEHDAPQAVIADLEAAGATVLRAGPVRSREAEAA